jgi:hypothetical protein
MPTEAIGATAPEPTEATVVVDVDPRTDKTESSKPAGLHSPPDSNNAMALDGSDSELSDIEDRVADQLRDEAPPVPDVPVVEDIGEIIPDHYSGTVPVFKPTMQQFKDFKPFVSHDRWMVPFRSSNAQCLQPGCRWRRLIRTACNPELSRSSLHRNGKTRSLLWTT